MSQEATEQKTLGPYRTPDPDTLLITLYGQHGVMYRIVRRDVAPRGMYDCWVVPDTMARCDTAE